MAFNDSSYCVLQGALSLQRRALNGLPVGGFVNVGDCDKFEVSVAQTFDEIEESISGLGLTSGRAVTSTKLSVKANLLAFSKDNLVKALFGTDTSGGGVAAGSVAAELALAYNGKKVLMSAPGVSAVVIKLAKCDVNGNPVAGVTGALSSIAVTAGGTGYAANTVFALTLAGTGAGAVGYAVSNAAGVIVGAYIVPGSAGSGYTAPTAVVTTPGAGTGVTFQVNMAAAILALNTDYTYNAASGVITILPGSLLVPSFVDTFGLVADGQEGVALTTAYSYGAYGGKVEAFTTGIQYFTMLLEGVNTFNNQQTRALVYQGQFEMSKLWSLIDKKHNNIELNGMLIQDTTIALPTAAAPYSQFLQLTKG